MPMIFLLFQVAHEKCLLIEISKNEIFREIALAMSTSRVINVGIKNTFFCGFKYGLIQIFLLTSYIPIFKCELSARIICRGRGYEF